MGVGSVIKVAILGDAHSLIASAGESVVALEKVGQKGDSFGSKFAKMGGMVAGSVATLAVGLGVVAVKEADKLNESMDILKNSLAHAHEKMSDFGGGIPAVYSKMEHFGYTNADVNDSLSKFAITGVKAKESLKLMTLAADLAAYKHVSLADATMVVAKAHEGLIKPLKSLAIDLPIASQGALKVKHAQDGLTSANENLIKVLEAVHGHHLKGVAALTAVQKAHEKVTASQEKLSAAQNAGKEILTALNQKLGGQAATAAESLHGKIKELHAKFIDLTAHLGQKLIPVLVSIITWFTKHQSVAIALAVVVGGVLTAAFVAWAISLAPVAFLLGAITLPIAAIAISLVALTVAAVYLWTHWDEVWKWIMDHKAYALVLALLLPFIAILVAIVGAAKFLYDNWDAIWKGITDVARVAWAVIGPVVRFGMAVVSAAIDTISSIFGVWERAWGWVLDHVKAVWSLVHDAVSGGIDKVVGVVGGIGGRILSAVGDLGSTLIHAGEQLIQGLINGITNAGGGVLGAIKSVLPGPLQGLAHAAGIPGFATGGVVPGPVGGGVLALVHGGEGVFTPEQMRALSAGLGGRGGGSGSVVINMPAGVDPDAVVQAQKRYNRRNGL